MSTCKMIEFLFAVFPLKIWQDFLIRRHMRDCQNCRGKLATQNETLEKLIREEHITDAEALWAGFESGLKAEKRKPKPVNLTLWKWAYGVAAAFVIVAGIYVVSNISRWGNGRAEQITADHFQINYLKVDGEPAQAFLFKPQGTDMIIVWAQKIR